MLKVALFHLDSPICSNWSDSERGLHQRKLQIYVKLQNHGRHYCNSVVLQLERDADQHRFVPRKKCTSNKSRYVHCIADLTTLRRKLLFPSGCDETDGFGIDAASSGYC